MTVTPALSPTLARLRTAGQNAVMNRRRRALALPLLLLALAATGCGNKDDDPTLSQPPTSNSPSATVEPTTDAASAISIIDFSFTPATLTVPLNTTVTASSRGDQSHTWTSKPGQALSWDFPLENGESAEFTFTKAGSFGYLCSVHPSRMTGTVVVTG